MRAHIENLISSDMGCKNSSDGMQSTLAKSLNAAIYSSKSGLSVGVSQDCFTGGLEVDLAAAFWFLC